METSSSAVADAPKPARPYPVREWIALAIVMAVLMQLGPLFDLSGGIPKLQLKLWDWFIEDAAISFAYARHWADGEGLVPFVGGERVEGYSNPLWVALIALGYLVGIDGFISSKIYALVFAVGTVVAVSKLAAAATHKDHPSVWLAPLFVGLNPQFAFWNASGLENSLFNVLLATGMWRTFVEPKHGGWPVAAWAFLGVAVTRPEGILYAAIAGFAYMVLAWREGRGIGPTLVWLAAFFVPFSVYHAVRYDYFAYAFPNTFYAKLGDRDFRPFQWNNPGWRYVRNYAYETGTIYSLPVFLMGLIGFEGWRKRLYWAGLAALTVLMVYPGIRALELLPFWPGDLPAPRWWGEARVWGLLVAMVALPILSVGTRYWPARVMTWGMTCLTVLFAMRAHGDWMRGFRWMSLCVVPMSLLFAIGAKDASVALSRVIGRRFGPRPGMRQTVLYVLFAALLPGWLIHSGMFFNKRETGPYSVKKRVAYTTGITDRLFLEGPIVNLDVDMGAHVYWSDHRIVDLAGLLDVPIAHHRFEQRAFTGEYIFKEQKPHFAHVHGGWANKSKIPRFPEWEERYVELPGYPVSRRSVHPGNHIRRDLFLRKEWSGPDRRAVEFEGGVVLVGWKITADTISAGKSFFFEVAFRNASDEELTDFRVVAFLSGGDGVLHTFELPMAYDWVPASEWNDDEVFRGLFAPMLPRELPAGTYDLGFAVFDADGAPLAATRRPPSGHESSRADGLRIGGKAGQPVRFVRGEARFVDAVTLGEAGTAERGASAAFQRAMGTAKAGRCLESERAWRTSWRHIPRAERWKEGRLAELRPALGDCWARHALAVEGPENKAVSIARARHWAHRSAAVQDIGVELGDQWMAEGLDARDAQDWERAYRSFDRALRANPSLAWARRYAEEARDHRLRIDQASVDEDNEARRERIEKLRARRKQGAADAKSRPDATPEVVGGEGLLRLGRPPEGREAPDAVEEPDAGDVGSAEER